MGDKSLSVSHLGEEIQKISSWYKMKEKHGEKPTVAQLKQLSLIFLHWRNCHLEERPNCQFLKMSERIWIIFNKDWQNISWNLATISDERGILYGFLMIICKVLELHIKSETHEISWFLTQRFQICDQQKPIILLQLVWCWLHVSVKGFFFTKAHQMRFIWIWLSEFSFLILSYFPPSTGAMVREWLTGEWRTWVSHRVVNIRPESDPHNSSASSMYHHHHLYHLYLLHHLYLLYHHHPLLWTNSPFTPKKGKLSFLIKTFISK